jgi:hypothetical protein
MAKLVFGLQQSLDGYVDHLEMGPPRPAVFRHFVEHVRELAMAIWRPIERLGIRYSKAPQTLRSNRRET